MSDEPSTLDAKSGFRTLIVDDNVGSAKILGTLFKKLGQDQVELAHCGRDAIEKAQHYKPDVVVLDLTLGDISGLEVAQTLKQGADFHDTLLVALTGRDSAEDRQQTSDAGFHLHRVKPFGVEVVHEILTLMRERPIKKVSNKVNNNV